jgi:hypothetical protein
MYVLFKKARRRCVMLTWAASRSPDRLALQGRHCDQASWEFEVQQVLPAVLQLAQVLARTQCVAAALALAGRLPQAALLLVL